MMWLARTCAFKGVPYYPLKHPDGFGSSWNVIYGGYNENYEQIFYAHGFAKPLTEREIQELFLQEYNLERTPGDLACIQAHSDPAMYSTVQNPNLRNSYTIPRHLMDYLIFGYAGSLVKCVEPKFVYLLKNCSDIISLQSELWLRSRLSLFKLKPGQHVKFQPER